MVYYKREKNRIARISFFIYELYFKLIKLILIKLGTVFIFHRKNWCTNRLRNICVVSSKMCSLSRYFKVSRIILRQFSNLGYFFGLKKAS